MKRPTAARPAPAELEIAAPVNIAVELGVEVGPTGVAVAELVVLTPGPPVETVPLLG
jgi:flagellar motor switch/type III secretory pathway protein FliN